MDCPQSVTIPIIRFGSTKGNVSFDQSESSISGGSRFLPTFNKGKIEKVFTSPEIPFGLKKLSRNPKDILEKKASMVGKEINGGFVSKIRDIKVESMTSVPIDFPKLKINKLKEEIHENLKHPQISSLLKRNIEAEIDLKLNYLDQIQQLQEKVKYEQSKTHDEKIKATQIIKVLKEEKEELIKLHHGVKKEKIALTMECFELENKLGEIIPELLAIKDLEDRSIGDIKQVLGGNIMIPQGPCMQFSNLFDLSGQLSDFSCGEYGSKFILERLQNGVTPEKDFAMKELNLPNSLSHVLENHNSSQVATVLAILDHKGREEILSHLEAQFSKISSTVEGRKFIADVFKKANKTEKRRIAQYASTSMSNLQTYPDKDLIEELSYLNLESQQECQEIDC